MKILLTGSTGFLGSAIHEQLESSEHELLPIVRVINSFSPKNAKAVNNIDGYTDYSDVLGGINTVVHAAARTHIMEDEGDESLAEYQKVNVAGSENLARQAAVAGVKRFIFISSIKVSGERTSSFISFNEDMKPAPEDAYGQSKHEAEQVLKQVAAEADMELVIIRPPLVYGPGVKANFRNLLKLSSMSIPLPFGSVSNQRSMIYLGNLVDFIIHCIGHPKAANQTFLVSDGQDVSLKFLISLIRQSMGKPEWLVPVHIGLFRFIGKLTGRMDIVDRLIGDLQLDISKARRLLDWVPPFTVEQGMAETVVDFSNSSR